MSSKPFNLEIREVGAVSTGRLPEVDEARRRRSSHERNPSSFELSIREPGKPGSINKSESAAMGGTINLQENRTVFTQNQPNQQATVARMTESFERLGLSEVAAREAARGRDNERVFVDDFIPFAAEEAKRNAELLDESRKHTEQTQEQMFEAFRRMGLGDEAARRAARGRGSY